MRHHRGDFLLPIRPLGPVRHTHQRRGGIIEIIKNIDNWHCNVSTDLLQTIMVANLFSKFLLMRNQIYVGGVDFLINLYFLNVEIVINFAD